jgi:hypothetical protein
MILYEHNARYAPAARAREEVIQMNVVLNSDDAKRIKKLLAIADFMPDRHYTIEITGMGGDRINVYNVTDYEIAELHRRGATKLIRGVTRGTAKHDIFEVY